MKNFLHGYLPGVLKNMVNAVVECFFVEREVYKYISVSSTSFLLPSMCGLSYYTKVKITMKSENFESFKDIGVAMMEQLKALMGEGI